MLTKLLVYREDAEYKRDCFSKKKTIENQPIKN